MNEQRVKKRDWVLKAVIIFLVVMLFLTFFSNTIMNRSLPEVAAQYTSSGAITARIRGMGTVSANDSYEVILNQTRTVKEVNVRVGNEISAGDLMFTLADAGSEELEAAQEKLKGLLLDYERKVISASLNGDYAGENRSIEIAREDLTIAEEERDEIPYSEESVAAARSSKASAQAAVDSSLIRVKAAEGTVTNAENSLNSAKETLATRQSAVNTAQSNVDTRQAAVEAARDSLYALGGADTADIDRQLNEVRAQIISKQDELQAGNLVHGDNYALFEQATEAWASSTSLVPPDEWDEHWKNQKAIYLAAYAQILDEKDDRLIAYKAITNLENQLATLQARESQLIQQLNSAMGANSTEYNLRRRRLTDAEDALSTAKTALTNAESRLAYAQTAHDDAENTLSDAEWWLNSANNAHTFAKDALDEASEDLEKQLGYKTEWRAANSAVNNLQRTLEGLIFSLSEKQKADGVTSALTNIDMRELRNDIEKTRGEIEHLEEDGTGATIASPVSGIVKSINISPGNQTQSGSPLAVIEVVDRGYSLSLTVTAEQARRVTVGDNAQLNRGWWGGGDLNAILRLIRNDPQNPAQSRILEFDVYGDVESGMQVNVTMGQRSENYEIIVPNSALRSDTNGDFVLVVLARSSPLGNRYMATRADVSILAADDLNSAVSGALTGWDFVITTSTKPIEPGMQVRLVDNPW